MRYRHNFHPGECLRQDFVEPFGLDIGALAANIGVPREMVDALLRREAPMTHELAIRLSKALGTAPGAWMQLQSDFEMDQWEKRGGTDTSGIRRMVPEVEIPEALAEALRRAKAAHP